MSEPSLQYENNIYIFKPSSVYPGMSFLISSDPSPGKPGFHSIHRGQSLSGLLFAHGYQISGGSEAEP